MRIERGDQNDRQQRRPGFGTNTTAHVIARHAGHHHIEQYDVGALVRHLGKCFLAIDRRHDRITLDP